MAKVAGIVATIGAKGVRRGVKTGRRHLPVHNHPPSHSSHHLRRRRRRGSVVARGLVRVPRGATTLSYKASSKSVSSPAFNLPSPAENTGKRYIKVSRCRFKNLLNLIALSFSTVKIVLPLVEKSLYLEENIGKMLLLRVIFRILIISYSNSNNFNNFHFNFAINDSVKR